MKKINIFINDLKFEAELNDTKIAEEIYKVLPIETEGNTWGNEIYFEIPVEMENENPTENIKVGDLTYWPEGDGFCIFYGRTPASTDDEPKPASPVTVIGGIQGELEQLKKIDRVQVKIVKI
jgi:hypothetical protein